jgi:predicted CXXCH cytochrome family protein
MASKNNIKVALLTVFTLVVFAWAFSATFSEVQGTVVVTEPVASASAGIMNQDDFVGSETCMACHEDQFKAFSGTKHAKLKEVPAWKDKAQGCESCHGPGAKHSADPTILGTIIAFNKMDSKAVSETCLACHSGKESHNTFRQGEHWRNDVGCTDCHSAHGTPAVVEKPGSITFASEPAHKGSAYATQAMLKQSDPQLCISCHNETKSQFTKPFHHKVLEGTMKCGDCHNAHGGFETKQTKLAIGSDASCIKCHSNKQGPFVFEHGPLKLEGCSTCHTPHGSANPKMLKRPQIRQTCLECHTGISEELAPGVPSFHNQANTRFTNCTVCHSAIHGSNSSRLFFR